MIDADNGQNAEECDKKLQRSTHVPSGLPAVQVRAGGNVSFERLYAECGTENILEL